MMKICHLTSAHDSNDTRIFYKECCSLAMEGYDTYLVAAGKSRIEKGVHVIGVGVPPHSRFMRMTSFARKIYEVAIGIDADVYHIHDPDLLLYCRKLRRAGKKVIFDSHENYTMQIAEKEYIPKFLRNIIGKIYYLYETGVVKRIDAVIVPCTFSGKNIFSNRAKRTELIANYPLLTELYNKYIEDSIANNEVCYMGQLSKENGVGDLIKACYRIGVPLVLAGASNNYFLELQQDETYNCVKYKGVLNREEIYQLLQHSKIGAYVNRHIGQNKCLDTFGIKVYEFMSMGLPIVVDNTPYSKMFIDKYKCGIAVENGSIDEISKAIQYLLEHHQESKIMGKNARFAVKNEFNWETQEKKLAKLYRELTEK